MIHLRSDPCPAEILGELAQHQRRVDEAGGYVQQVKAAATAWESCRKKKVLRDVRGLLRAMCSGSARCMFCEDSAGAHIEHFRPKSRYPGLVFAWANLLYACSVCNERKGSRFKIRRADGRILRLRSRARTAPPAGEPLLIDPRHDDPMELLFLELETGKLMPRSEPGTPGFSRAISTIKTLGLNERDAFRRARRRMFLTYRTLLERYVARKRKGAAPAELRRLIEVIRGHGHRTVWEEMKRQREQRPKLRALFAQAPEALTW